MLKKAQVLVIDNDDNILWAFRNFLKKEKISMVGKTSIEEGLKILHKRKFSLIIIDMKPNIESVIKLIQEAKQQLNNIPIIAITSFPDIINEKMLKPYGVEYLFIKPLELSELEKAVSKCLKLSLTRQSMIN